MTFEMEYLIYLYSCSSCGIKANPPIREIDWNRIVQLSIEQSITYTTAIAIKNSDLNCPADIKNRLISSLRGASIKNVIKTEKILSLVDKMNSAGIKTAIIKGIEVARFYANPECRVSSDTDLLISPEDEDTAIAFLNNNGFIMKPRGANDNHAVGYHSEMGMVELHVMLFPEIVNNSQFNSWIINKGGLTNSQDTQIEGKHFYSLEPTENLMFLTYHLIKHFIYNGISLRMIMDIALFAKHNRELIDSKRYFSALSETRYIYIMQLIFGIMVKYGGFSENDFPIEPKYDNEMITAILDDLEDSGWQGFNKGEGGGARIQAYSYYLYKTSVDENNIEKKKNIDKYLKSSYARLIFPPSEILQKSYPELKNRPNLYPVYWTHRLFSKGIPGFFNGRMRSFNLHKNQYILSSTARQKVKLFKKLKLLK